MFGDRCARCFVKADKIRLFDVIYEGKIGLLCERCAIIENIPLIKRPEENQIKESEKPPTVHDRMKKISGILDFQEHGEVLRSERLNELERNPELGAPVREKLDMIEHFNWVILRERRRKGLTQERLSEAVNIPVEYVELLEKGNVPNNIEILKKLENFFKVRLMKKSPFREIKEEQPILLDEEGNVLDHIPEPEMEDKFSEDDYTNKLIKEERETDFEIKKADLNKVSLKDLMELHRKKILVSREEQKTEQGQIEEKQKTIEARKEELRFLREKQSRDLDNLLGGSELLEDGEKENKVDKLFEDTFG